MNCDAGRLLRFPAAIAIVQEAHRISLKPSVQLQQGLCVQNDGESTSSPLASPKPTSHLGGEVFSELYSRVGDATGISRKLDSQLGALQTSKISPGLGRAGSFTLSSPSAYTQPKELHGSLLRAVWHKL